MRVQPRLIQVERRPAEVRAPGEPWPGVRRLVVIRADRLGDLIVSLPAVQSLRRAYPAARLGLMVAPAYASLGRCVEGVDHVFEAGSDGEGMRRLLEVFACDLAVCISRGPAAAWAAFRSGAPHRVGSGRRFYSGLFDRRVDEGRRRGGRHEVEYALSFAHRAGGPAGPCHFGLEPPREALEAVALWLGERGIAEPFVVLHPGSGGSCPRWPLAAYARLATLVAMERIPVVISVGPGELAPQLGSTGAEQRITRFSGSLPALAALVRRAALVVGNSSGPVHLAAAQRTPALALHAPWATCGVARWGPYGGNGWGLVADHPEARRWSVRQRRRGAAALMAGLSPELVQRCVLEIVAGRSPAGVIPSTV